VTHLDFRIEPQTGKILLTDANDSVVLSRLAEVAREHAVPIFSGKQVGAIVATESGQLVAGANIELGSSSYRFGIHAEQLAIANAIAIAGNDCNLVRAACTHTPCGLCCEYFLEFACTSNLPILVPSSAEYALSDLVPVLRGRKQQSVKQELSLMAQPSLNSLNSLDSLFAVAMSAASKSYVPYSKRPSGCAIEMADGLVFTGFDVEIGSVQGLREIEIALARVAFAGQLFQDIERIAMVCIYPSSGRLSYARTILKIINIPVDIEAFMTGPLK
jgi:cytidine deaminase